MNGSSEARSFVWPIVICGVVGLLGIWIIETNEKGNGIWLGLALIGLAVAGIVRYETAERRASRAATSRGNAVALAAAIVPWLAILLGILSDTPSLVSLGAVGVWLIPVAIVVAAFTRSKNQ